MTIVEITGGMLRAARISQQEVADEVAGEKSQLHALKMKDADWCRERDNKDPECVVESEIGKGRDMKVDGVPLGNLPGHLLYGDHRRHRFYCRQSDVARPARVNSPPAPAFLPLQHIKTMVSPLTRGATCRGTLEDKHLDHHWAPPILAGAYASTQAKPKLRRVMATRRESPKWAAQIIQQSQNLTVIEPTIHGEASGPGSDGWQ
jgi:hypothetical protein